MGGGREILAGLRAGSARRGAKNVSAYLTFGAGEGA